MLLVVISDERTDGGKERGRQGKDNWVKVGRVRGGESRDAMMRVR